MKFPFNNSISEIEKKFDIIKQSKAALFSFFSMMPKGGNLHQHFASTVYVEHYVDYLLKQPYFINVKNLVILATLDNVTEGVEDFIPLKDMPESVRIEYKLKLMKEWNVKDYYTLVSTDLHYFAVFGYFDLGANNFNYRESLLDLKNRALNQNVSYVESMFLYCNSQSVKSAHAEVLAKGNTALMAFNKTLNKMPNPLSQENYLAFKAIVDNIFAECKDSIIAAAQTHNNIVETALVGINDENFAIQFQNFVFRNEMPMDVFIAMATAFQSASTSKNISGVNIVSAEHGAMALDCYNLHMLFYQYFEALYPKEKYTIQAGEFASNTVKSDHLGIHVRKALNLKNLRRIAHGLDIIYDNHFIDTIQQIQARNEVAQALKGNYELNFDIEFLEQSYVEDKNYLAFECNFSINKHLLQIEEDIHPATIYLKHNIPMVVCTDDAGVLSTNMTEQFVTLVTKFGFTYKDIKKMCFDSIRYANLKDFSTKKALFAKLLADFDAFENRIDEISEAYKDRVSTIGFSKQIV